ncbi:hypothetical protein K1T71_014485 [Dendrolimus kikuchii]|uniref:Uncharacterized protein n=1 Tax=Dendrolimus kikuchii TaxID=765133 RepID=A0ACC1CE87_9NEOP|nr:hypothetical protein K1T71_014485 [Dendrolimus kikuchii]
MFNVLLLIVLCFGAPVKANWEIAALNKLTIFDYADLYTMCRRPIPINGTKFNIDVLTTSKYGLELYTYGYVTIDCEESYELVGNKTVRCLHGKYLEPLGKCVPKLLTNTNADDSQSNETFCELPEHTKHGSYKYSGAAKYNIEYFSIILTYKCNYGYELKGNNENECFDGSWMRDMPTCEAKYGYLVDPLETGTRRSLTHCIVPDAPKNGSHSVLGEEHPKIPNAYTKVYVDITCNEGYQIHGDQSTSCTSGKWSAAMPLCGPCGLITVSDGLIIGGFEVQWGEVPWHAGLYRKNSEPFEQICGGTIVTSTAIISAAHCFWITKQIEVLPRKYSVGVGKIYRPWHDIHDIFAQKLEITEIKIPTMYFGSSANFQNDLAVLKLLTAIEFNRYVRPICLDFNEEINGNPLDDGMRKVAGWGLKTEEGETSQALKAVYFPIVHSEKCSKESPYAFRPYITIDKICAGYTNGTAVCKGDSGGGLTFHRVENGVYKHYLQGVVSTAPNYGTQECNAYTWATFTSIVKHKSFIYENIK